MLLLFPGLLAHAQNAWNFAGNSIANNRWASAETTLTTANVNSLAVQWSFRTQNDVSATPSVDSSGNVYFPDWSGNIYKLSPSGQVIWQTTPPPKFPAGTLSRTTPTLSGNFVLIRLSATFSTGNPTGAYFAALNSSTGTYLWVTSLDPYIRSVTTGSPVVYNGIVYIGVSSAGEKDPLWSFQAAGSVNAAPAVVNGVVYWGSGYHNFPKKDPIGTASNEFYVFGLPLSGSRR